MIRTLLRAVAVVASFFSLSLATGASAASLYTGPGPRPGPDILYEKPATAPQLTNGPGWKASPILISGGSSYRSGEFVYQDYLYDDHGANGGQRDQNDPRGANAGTAGDSFSAPNGTYTYPSAPAYAMNAADLVELRVKPSSDHTAFRITLNTMKDPSLVGTTIAIGSSPGNVDMPMPDGANTGAPADMFLTVHGTTAKLVKAGTNTAVPGGTSSVAVDTNRRQIEVDVPHSLWDPTGKTVRLAAAVGLWDKAGDKYLIPQQNSDGAHPGGAGTLSAPSAFFNVAFRSEPTAAPTDLSAVADPAWWRDRAQGHALASGSIGQFSANVDFKKLAAGTTDNGGVPATGAMDRILASHFETEQGVDYSQTCGSTDSCLGEYRGRLQPYAIYVPKKPRPAAGYGMTLLLHSLGANYNQYLTSRNQSEFGERGPGSIVITPEGRGPDGWYYDAAGADTFEVWADAASHLKLDPDWTVIAGYSMGGYGTFKFASQFPDLFAKGQPTVGPPALGIWVPPAPPTSGERSNTNHMLPSVRNVPFLIWNAVQDELVPYAGATVQAQTFDQLGYRYIWDSFAPAEHLTLAFHDQYKPAADFLGTTKVNRNPPHVTYVVNPTMDFPKPGTVADHAYWLSRMKLRDASGDAPLGTIDVRSHGFGVADPPAGSTQHGGGTLGPGTLGQLPFVEQSKSWGNAAGEAKLDRLDITATNVRTVTIDPARARVDCDAQLVVKSDGPLSVTLAGCGRNAAVGGGRCDVSRPPGASVSRTSRLRRRSVSLRGRAVAFRCSGNTTVPGTVERVYVAISRGAGHGRCRFLKPNGRLSAPRSCSRMLKLRGRLGRIRAGKVPWTFSRGVHLARGRYTVAIIAVDSRGHTGGRRGRFNRRAFSVR